MKLEKKYTTNQLWSKEITFNTSAFYIISFVIASIGLILHYISLNQTGYANGWDSYFYLLQIKSLINDGHLISSRLSLFYPLLVCAKWITGDYINGYKILTALLASTVIFLNACIVYQITRNKIAATVTSLLTLWSPHLFYFSSQYANNLAGYAFFLIFILFLLDKKYVFAIIFVIVNLFTHKLTGMLSVGTLIIYTIFQLLVYNKHKKILIWGLIPIVIVMFIPKIFAFHEVNRQLDIFTLTPQIYVLQFIDYFKGIITKIWISEIITTAIAFIGFTAILIIKKSKSIELWLFPILFSLLNFPFLKWDTDGFSYRFFLLSMLFSSVFTGLIISYIHEKKNMLIVLIITILSTVTTAFSCKTYNPKLNDPPYNRYEIITKNLKNSKVFNTADLFIAHKSLAEFIKFTTNKDVMPWIPEYHIEDEKLWRIVADIDPYILNSFLKNDTVFYLGFNYCLMKDSQWKSFIADILANDSDFYDDYTTWLNPNQVRPAFLQKYRRKDVKK